VWNVPRTRMMITAYKLVVWKHEGEGLFWETKLKRKDNVTLDLRRLSIY